MGQVVQTNGDYTIKTGEGNKILLDTGTNVGEVRVTGNLIVTGTTLTVDAANLNVKDNVIILNFGEEGAGVSLKYSGIQIDRGSLPPASLIYSEDEGVWLLATGEIPGPFSFGTDGTEGPTPRSSSRLRLKEILTDSNADSGDLILINEGTGVVKIGDRSPGPGYETFVTDDNDIPNKKYVDLAIQNNPTFQILADPPSNPLSPLPNNTSRVIVTDKDATVSTPSFFFNQTGYNTFGESAVSVLVDGQLIAQFYTNRAEIGGLEIGGGETSYEISTKAFVTNENIFIRTQGTGKLQTNYALQLDKIGSTPAWNNPNSTLLFSKSPDIGTTGLFFAHSERHGELISKNKALVFSMLF